MKTTAGTPVRVPPLEPVFYGTGQMLLWEPAALLDSIDRQEFLVKHWGVPRGRQSTESAIRAERLELTYEKRASEIRNDGLVDARGYYGFFPVITDDEDVVVLDPGDFHTERATFHMARLSQSGGRSFADYFRPEGDIVAFLAVCLGPALANRVDQLALEPKTAERASQFDAVGASLLDQVAERTTREVRRALGIPRTRGGRLVFGDAGMPGRQELPVLLELIAAEERLGLALREDLGIEPRHSCVGMFVHHPDIEEASRGCSPGSSQGREEGHVTG